jgi:hypothetical protein
MRSLTTQQPRDCAAARRRPSPRPRVAELAERRAAALPAQRPKVIEGVIVAESAPRPIWHILVIVAVQLVALGFALGWWWFR